MADSNTNSRCNRSTEPVHSRHHNMTPNSRKGHWTVPNRNTLKCNFDANFNNGSSITNAGWVIRNYEGQPLI